MRVEVVGAGVAGLTVAFELARQGAVQALRVELVERRPRAGLGCSRYAGGMIAPWCELESAEPIDATLGVEALEFWTKDIPVATVAGSLVVAPARDRAELVDFARRAQNFEELHAAGVAALEGDLASRFDSAVYFASEAHLDPRAAMTALGERLAAMHKSLRFGECARGDADWTVDCRGFAARDELAGLRGVKGEMVMLRSGISRCRAGSDVASQAPGLCRATRRRPFHDLSDYYRE